MTEPKKKCPGRWKLGQSGNPAGRPPGAGEVSKLRASIAARVPELLAALIDKALEGDVGACRLLIERVLPALKPSEQTQALSLPDSSLSDQGRAVLAAVAAGQLAPGQGAQLIGAIAGLARVSEIDEMETRLTQLEEKQNAKP